MFGLRKIQFEAGAFMMPKYKPHYFSTVEDFNDYISTEDYGVETDGVCVAV